MPRPTPEPVPTGHPGTAAFPVVPATGADAPWRASSLNHTSSSPGTPGTGGGGGRPWHPGRTGSGASAPNAGETFINSAAIVANAPLRVSLDQRAGGVQAWEARRQNFWNQWAAQHAGRLDDFASQRQDLWNRTREFRGNHWDQIQQHGDAWRQWRESMLNFRAQRGDEIRDGYRDAYCEWFTPGWFLRHRWWLNAYAINYAVSPWWCWQGPADFGSYSAIYNSAPPDAVTDDYGTDIVMNGDNVYVDGQDTGSAEAWRAQAIALANPTVMPPPPLPQGDNDPSIMPLGVWALTAEETGNAVIFYQLAATRDGLITGTYSNILTGDSGPLIGSIDKKSQRLAFHAGNVTQTVVETNLNGLTREQTAAYIHFGIAQTQEWMLVRMADPGVGGSNQ
jgi:hypothetical protein